MKFQFIYHAVCAIQILATDWVGDVGIEGNDAVETAKTLKSHGCGIIDVSTGQTTTDATPVYGRMFQTVLSEQVRNEADIPTIAVSKFTTWDQVNTIIATGRTDIVALARAYLTNPLLPWRQPHTAATKINAGRSCMLQVRNNSHG